MTLWLCTTASATHPRTSRWEKNTDGMQRERERERENRYGELMNRGPQEVLGIGADRSAARRDKKYNARARARAPRAHMCNCTYMYNPLLPHTAQSAAWALANGAPRCGRAGLDLRRACRAHTLVQAGQDGVRLRLRQADVAQLRLRHAVQASRHLRLAAFLAGEFVGEAHVRMQLVQKALRCRAQNPVGQRPLMPKHPIEAAAATESTIDRLQRRGCANH